MARRPALAFTAAFATVVWALAAAPVVAQVLTHPAEPVQPTILRYDENWSVLADPATRTGRWAERFKYFQVGRDAWATTGVELRLRNENYHGAQWGGAPDQADRWIRLLPYADLHAGRFRAFVQPVIAYADGLRPTTGPVDETGVDLLQGFGEASFGSTEKARFTVRAGRQMMTLGSQRLVGARYGPNVPLAFDGVRVIAALDRAELSLFATRPVQAGPRDFDDSRSERKALWGAYLTLPSLDLYYLGYENRTARYAGSSGSEHRDSVGARLHGASRSWHWNIEGVGQFGEIDDRRILAWTLANEVGRKFNAGALPLDATLRFDVISGDRSTADGKVETFNALFPRGKYFGELSPIGPANIIHLSPQISAQLTPTLTLGVATMAYWRQSLDDGVYDVPGNLLRAPAGARARFIGKQAEATLAWQATPEWGALTSLSAFMPGDYIRQTGSDRTIVLFAVETTFRF